MRGSTRLLWSALVLRSRAGTRSQRHGVRHPGLPGFEVPSSTRVKVVCWVSAEVFRYDQYRGNFVHWARQRLLSEPCC